MGTTLVIVVEDHYIATPDGVFARQGMGHPYAYWRQFLDLYDRVEPVGRVARAGRTDPAWRRADGPGVSFLAVRDHTGPAAILRALPHTVRRLDRAARRGDYFFLRGGGAMSTLAWLRLRLSGTPYARQVVGRDGEAIAFALRRRPRTVRAAVARAADWLARRQIAGAVCAAYVAPGLRDSYPPAPGAPVFCYSDVTLSPDVVTGPRSSDGFSADPLRLVSVGRASAEKGHHVLIDALARLDGPARGRVSLTLVGDGPELGALRALAARLGLADRVRFSGLVPWGEALFAALDAADLFVLPSLTEGLPRALLEAMSRGLAAVGTRVGGVPDLLAGADLVPPGDPAALAAAIARYLGRPDLLAASSRRGFAAAARWYPEVMAAQKLAFFAALRRLTDARR